MEKVALPSQCWDKTQGKLKQASFDAVVGGWNRQLFVAKDVRVSGNIGWQGSTGEYYADQPLPGHTFAQPWPGAGWLRLLGDDAAPWLQQQRSTQTAAPATGTTGGAVGTGVQVVNRTAMRGCMDYHTWTADRVRVRNLLKPTALLGQLRPADPGGATPMLTRSSNYTIDGDAVFEWRQGPTHANNDSSSSSKATGGGGGSTSLVLGTLDLASNPSVLNRSVFLAVDARLLVNATLELLIDAVRHNITPGVVLRRFRMKPDRLPRQARD
jgi:hypothetical protein